MNSLSFTIIQTNLVWENRQANLSNLENRIRSVGKKGIVIFPEMFTTGFSMQPEKFSETMNGETVEWMKRISSEHKIILTGSLMVNEDEKYFNRMLWVTPDGNISYYDKRHLFAFSKENEHYEAGNKRVIASVNGWKILLQVCYDLRFPVWCRQNNSGMEPEYDAIIYVANWPQQRSHAWKTLLVARAIENQCYVIGVNRVGNDGNGNNYSGDSMIIGPLGETIAALNDSEEIVTEVLNMDILKEARNKFPFLKDKDSFKIHL